MQCFASASAFADWRKRWSPASAGMTRGNTTVLRAPDPDHVGLRYADKDKPQR